MIPRTNKFHYFPSLHNHSDFFLRQESCKELWAEGERDELICRETRQVRVKVNLVLGESLFFFYDIPSSPRRV